MRGEVRASDGARQAVVLPCSASEQEEPHDGVEDLHEELANSWEAKEPKGRRHRDTSFWAMDEGIEEHEAPHFLRVCRRPKKGDGSTPIVYDEGYPSKPEGIDELREAVCVPADAQVLDRRRLLGTPESKVVGHDHAVSLSNEGGDEAPIELSLIHISEPTRPY